MSEWLSSDNSTGEGSMNSLQEKQEIVESYLKSRGLTVAHIDNQMQAYQDSSNSLNGKMSSTSSNVVLKKNVSTIVNSTTGLGKYQCPDCLQSFNKWCKCLKHLTTSGHAGGVSTVKKMKNFSTKKMMKKKEKKMAKKMAKKKEKKMAKKKKKSIIGQPPQGDDVEEMSSPFDTVANYLRAMGGSAKLSRIGAVVLPQRHRGGATVKDALQNMGFLIFGEGGLCTCFLPTILE